MKKYFMILVAAIMVAYVSSCSKSDDDSSSYIDVSPKTMTVGESTNIEGMDSPISENKFVVTTNGNSITASHIGETNIRQGNSVKKITVVGSQIGYTDPITNWGETTGDVGRACSGYKVYEDKSISSNAYYDRMIIFKNVGEYSLLGYIFKENKLVAVQTYTSYSDMNSFVDYIKERYAFYKQVVGDYFVGIDALDLDSCKTIVRLEITSDAEIKTTYYDRTKFNI